MEKKVKDKKILKIGTEILESLDTLHTHTHRHSRKEEIRIRGKPP